VGLVLFAGGTLACALAPSLAALLVARVVMAVGSSMGQSVGTAMVVSVFPPEERGMAIGSQTTAVAIGAALGPILAGLVLQVTSWRVLFAVVAVPIVVAFVVGRRVLDEARVTPENDRAGNRFDMVGALLSVAAVTVVVLTISNPLALAWGDPLIVAGALAGAGLLALFVLWELRTDSPMLELRLLRNPVLATAIGTRFVGFMAGTVVQLLLPVYLISLRGLNEGTAGAIMFLNAVGLGLASQASGRLADRFGERPFLLLGFGTFIVTASSLRMIEETTALGLVAVFVLVNGMAQGTWSVPNSSMLVGSVPRSSLGVAGALSNLTRNVGNVVGQALATALVTAAMVRRDFDIPLDEIQDTPGADDAFVVGWQLSLAMVVGLTVIGFVISLVIRPRAIDETDSEVQPGALPKAAVAPDASTSL
jgi:MFS family permease